ncbi:MAG: hypothetical protein R8G60_02100 [Roseovarius pacificus]|nr:hypothetical protein [Roseovarius pacificus]
MPQVIVADRQVIVSPGIGSLVAQIPEVELGAFATDKASLKKLLSAVRGPAILILQGAAGRWRPDAGRWERCARIIRM